jgi:hypothetical protein
MYEFTTSRTGVPFEPALSLKVESATPAHTV